MVRTRLGTANIVLNISWLKTSPASKKFLSLVLTLPVVAVAAFDWVRGVVGPLPQDGAGHSCSFLAGVTSGSELDSWSCCLPMDEKSLKKAQTALQMSKCRGLDFAALDSCWLGILVNCTTSKRLHLFATRVIMCLTVPQKFFREAPKYLYETSFFVGNIVDALFCACAATCVHWDRGKFCLLNKQIV